METLTIPFDVSYHFNSRLREVPNAPAEMRRALFWLLDLLEQERLTSRMRIRLCGTGAGWARMLHQFDMAEALLYQALDLAESLHEVRLRFVNQLRLAHVHQWRANYSDSDRLFRNLLSWCCADRQLHRYLDFAYQHSGKNSFDQGRYQQALTDFEVALAIRNGKGDQELIDSTRFALAVTQAQLQTAG